MKIFGAQQEWIPLPHSVGNCISASHHTRQLVERKEHSTRKLAVWFFIHLSFCVLLFVVFDLVKSEIRATRCLAIHCAEYIASFLSQHSVNGTVPFYIVHNHSLCEQAQKMRVVSLSRIALRHIHSHIKFYFICLFRAFCRVCEWTEKKEHGKCDRKPRCSSPLLAVVHSTISYWSKCN